EATSSISGQLQYYSRPKICVAKDDAFCFMYPDNLSLLEELGAEVEFFSPLADSVLPDDADGVMLFSGYPELYAEQLAANQSMRLSMHDAISKGLPVYAEGGGFVYLQQNLTVADGSSHEMAGILPGNAVLATQLQDFGYFSITAKVDNLLCQAGKEINAHFFSYLVSDYMGNSFIARKPNGKTIECIVTTDTIFAGFQHLHFYSNIKFAQNLVQACVKYREGKHG
ncbi:MAG: cobyrinic acid a,c-diamide synthase, partial [Coriobacteriia bacterium]|nr:cobyrinic acid a,c-diamide synthase [Coriobacteriia bacterium]